MRGIGYKAGKSDTPLVAGVSVPLPVSARKFRRSSRALQMAVGEGISIVFSATGTSFYCGGNFGHDDEGYRTIRPTFNSGVAI